jgi:predicted porin
LLSLGLTFAETTLYGNVDQAWYKITQKSGGDTVSDVTGLASVQMGGGVLGVKGSEDLSGGLKASYTIEIQPPIDEVSAGDVWNRQAFVGLSGGFGALRIGKQYSNAFMNTVSIDPAGATGLAGNNAYCVQLAYTKCAGGSDGPLRQSNGMQYDLPEMLPGLKVGLTVVFGEKTSKAGDGNGFNVSYTTGPFYAGYTFDRVKNTGIGLLTSPGSTVEHPTAITVKVTNTDYDVASASTSDQNELTTLSASYDLGVAKVSINNSKVSVGSKSVDNTFVAVSVPFGGNANVWASMSKGSAYRTNVSANKDHEGFQVGVNYALSKRTVLYAQYGQMELESGLAANKKFEQTGSAIGVHHSF